MEKISIGLSVSFFCTISRGWGKNDEKKIAINNENNENNENNYIIKFIWKKIHHKVRHLRLSKTACPLAVFRSRKDFPRVDTTAVVLGRGGSLAVSLNIPRIRTRLPGRKRVEVKWSSLLHPSRPAQCTFQRST